MGWSFRAEFVVVAEEVFESQAFGDRRVAKNCVEEVEVAGSRESEVVGERLESEVG